MLLRENCLKYVAIVLFQIIDLFQNYLKYVASFISNH